MAPHDSRRVQTNLFAPKPNSIPLSSSYEFQQTVGSHARNASRRQSNDPRSHYPGLPEPKRRHTIPKHRHRSDRLVKASPRARTRSVCLCREERRRGRERRPHLEREGIVELAGTAWPPPPKPGSRAGEMGAGRVRVEVAGPAVGAQAREEGSGGRGAGGGQAGQALFPPAWCLLVACAPK